MLGIGLATATAIGFYVAGGGFSVRWSLATGIALLGPSAVWLTRPGPGVPIGRRRAIRRLSGVTGTILAGGIVAHIVGDPEPPADVRPGTALDPVEEKRTTGTTTPTSTPSASRERVDTRRETRGVVVSTSGTEAPFGFDFEGMPSRVGTADDHFVVDKNVSPPRVNGDQWTLTIDGATERSIEHTFGDLRNHPARLEQTVTMVCISNAVGGNLIGTTKWIGIPVRTLLEEAGVAENAVDVVTRAADGYSEALPWSVVRERDDILLAVGMDGKTLPTRHGFPARLLIPGRYGMKSTKWVTEFELARSDHEAYWEKRGWEEQAVVNTLSSIRAVQRRDGTVAIGGIADAGIRGIRRVEVSVDGGDTWTETTLEDSPSPFAWRRWLLTVDRKDTGPLEVVVRATDATGARQTSERTGPHPGGSTGWHSVTVSL